MLADAHGEFICGQLRLMPNGKAFKTTRCQDRAVEFRTVCALDYTSCCRRVDGIKPQGKILPKPPSSYGPITIPSWF